jgi:hypothetical protein
MMRPSGRGKGVLREIKEEENDGWSNFHGN